jgi:hypothetical protein
MSKVKIVGNASGSGTLTLTGPDTNSDRTITIPDETGTVALGVGIDDNADATAITIDSAENVGFGVTPTTYYSGYTGVQIGTNGTLYGQTAAGASNNFWVGQNVRAGTDGSEKAITTGVSSQMMQSGGQVVFKTGASASADANVTWTTTLDLKTDGRGVSQFTAAFWARINMEDSHAVIGSHNVSSVTDRGTGLGTLNFANNLSDANYCVTGSAFGGGGENDQREFQHSNEVVWSTSAWGWCTMDELEAVNDVRSANMIGFGG